MQFSCSTVLLAAVALAGTCMCCICGYMALDGTLDLFDKYGPREGIEMLKLALFLEELPIFVLILSNNIAYRKA